MFRVLFVSPWTMDHGPNIRLGKPDLFHGLPLEHFPRWCGESEKKTLPKEEGREGGGKKNLHRARAQTQDLLHSRRESVAECHSYCFDK